MPSAHALGLGDVRSKLTRPICAIPSSFLRAAFSRSDGVPPVRSSASNASRWALDGKQPDAAITETTATGFMEFV